MPGATDKEAFLKVFDQLKTELIGDFQDLPGLSDNLKEQLTTYYTECLETTVPGGKMTRGLTVVKGIEFPLLISEYLEGACKSAGVGTFAKYAS